ncbi:MAG TPA: transporter substrate-binding domain-containing protein [Rubrobacter sp.]|nr:transporter substrate-binding domain-containing protein [Rubrobacter sp.]
MIIGLFATAVVAGCGDDEDDSSGGSEGSTDLGLIQDGTLIVASDIPYPPFEQGDPPDYEGFDIDLINAVAEEMDLDVEIQDQPFEVILAGQQGRFDLSIAATTIKPARENRVDFSDPYFEASQSLLVTTDSDIESVDDITSDTVVGAEDTTTGETYANEETDGEVRAYASINEAFTALDNGQVDAVINDLPSSASAVEDSEGDLEIIEEFPTEELYGIVIPEDSDPLVEAVNEALATVKEDGTLDEIYQEWFGTDAPDTVLEATHEPT